MSKLIDLQSQIEILQKQASEIRRKEFDATIAEIQKLMTAYGITVKDLQTKKRKSKTALPLKAASSKPAKEKKVKKAVAPKYSGPNGETWSGRGLTPKWLATLIAAGHPKESFIIQPTTRS